MSRLQIHNHDIKDKKNKITKTSLYSFCIGNHMNLSAIWNKKAQVNFFP